MQERKSWFAGGNSWCRLYVNSTAMNDVRVIILFLCVIQGIWCAMNMLCLSVIPTVYICTSKEHVCTSTWFGGKKRNKWMHIHCEAVFFFFLFFLNTLSQNASSKHAWLCTINCSQKQRHGCLGGYKPPTCIRLSAGKMAGWSLDSSCAVSGVSVVLTWVVPSDRWVSMREMTWWPSGTGNYAKCNYLWEIWRGQDNQLFIFAVTSFSL